MPSRAAAGVTAHASGGPSSARLPQSPDLGEDGRLALSELTFDRPAAPSPFGEDVPFPMHGIAYTHPEPRKDSAPDEPRQH